MGKIEKGKKKGRKERKKKVERERRDRERTKAGGNMAESQVKGLGSVSFGEQAPGCGDTGVNNDYMRR